MDINKKKFPNSDLYSLASMVLSKIKTVYSSLFGDDYKVSYIVLSGHKIVRGICNKFSLRVHICFVGGNTIRVFKNVRDIIQFNEKN